MQLNIKGRRRLTVQQLEAWVIFNDHEFQKQN